MNWANFTQLIFAHYLAKLRTLQKRGKQQIALKSAIEKIAKGRQFGSFKIATTSSSSSPTNVKRSSLNFQAKSRQVSTTIFYGLLLSVRKKGHLSSYILHR